MSCCYNRQRSEVVKNRLHLDLRVPGLEAETARVAALEGSVLGHPGLALAQSVIDLRPIARGARR
ncbi:hypothetical protein [Actinoplanes sp. NPDC051411]|uniref:hypothetical protein n=1 Tax=Actinoplanes sp. NPDC051411 TaxID=3155522 RepID=UPI0034207D71